MQKNLKKVLGAVVLSAFAMGVVIGVLGMVPRWWQHRSAARKAQLIPPAAATAATPVPADTPAPLTQVPHGL